MKAFKKLTRRALALVSMVSIAGFTTSAFAGKATHDAMEDGHKGKNSLYKKVTGGSASDAEKKQLHDFYVAMSKDTVKKGSAESWKKKTAALVRTSKMVVDGKSQGVEALKKAANCKACHNVHREKK